MSSKEFADKIYRFKFIASPIVHRGNGDPWTNFEDQMVQKQFTHDRDNNNRLQVINWLQEGKCQQSTINVTSHQLTISRRGSGPFPSNV
jgi:hypothetical protein